MLLLLFGGGDLATNVTALVMSEPAATNGHAIDRAATAGEWRFAVEFADLTDLGAAALAGRGEGGRQPVSHEAPELGAAAGAAGELQDLADHARSLARGRAGRPSPCSACVMPGSPISSC